MKKREKRKNAISMLLRTSDIVNFIYEYKTLIGEEHTIAMTTKSLKTWKGDRLKQNTYLQVIWEATQLPIRIRVTNNL